MPPLIYRKNPSSPTPVFADVEADTLLIDPAAVEEKITDRTRAIIAVDYAGQPCDYNALRDIADRYGVALVADGRPPASVFSIPTIQHDIPLSPESIPCNRGGGAMTRPSPIQNNAANGAILIRRRK